MMKALFDPHGRLGPAAFQEAAIILIAIGALVSLVPWFEPALTMWTMVSFVLIYPWAVIWVKRFHDAGKPGWLFVPVLVVFLAVAWGVQYFVAAYFGPEQGVMPTDFAAAMAQANARAEAVAIPATIVSVIISLAFVFTGNALLKSDPGPNAYDPPDHMR